MTTTATEIEMPAREMAELKGLRWLPEAERAWLMLRVQIGQVAARRIEHHIILMVEALAEAGWTDRRIRDFLDAQRFREPENLDGAPREAAEALTRVAAEFGDEVTRTVIAFDTCEGGWQLVLEACEVQPRTERTRVR